MTSDYGHEQITAKKTLNSVKRLLRKAVSSHGTFEIKDIKLSALFIENLKGYMGADFSIRIYLKYKGREFCRQRGYTAKDEEARDFYHNYFCGINYLHEFKSFMFFVNEIIISALSWLCGQIQKTEA